MILTEDTSMQLSKGAITITWLSTLIGGHFTASHILYKFKFQTMEFIAQIWMGIIAVNIIYFLCCVGFVISGIPKKNTLIKATLFMLVNIPISIGYMIIILTNEF